MWWFVVVFVVALVIAYAMIPKPNDSKPQGLDDVTAPRAEIGISIPVLFGTKYIQGANLVWYGDLKTQAIRRSKQTIGYYYYLGMHMILCHGPIDFVSAVIADDKFAWTGNWVGGPLIFFNQSLFGGDDKEGGIAGRFDLDMGGPTQTPNTYLVSKLPGNVPAYRGVAGVIMQQIYVGTQVYLKKLGFLSSRIHVRTAQGTAQWYDAKSQVLSYAPEYESFLETFSEGLVNYSVTSGVLSAFTVAADTYGPAMNFGSTSSVVNEIQAPTPNVYFTGISLKFKLTATGAGDSATIILRDSTGASVCYFIISRDSSFDSSQRPNIGFVTYSGAPGYPIGAGRVTTNTWYQLTCNYDPNTSGFTAQITNIATGVVFGSVSVTAPIINPISFIAFSDNEGDASRGQWGSFADIHIRSRKVAADMNPAHIIRECLTDPDWGMGYQDADVDNTSFTAAADQLFSEGMGMSMLWAKQTTIEDFIKLVIQHIDATLYVDKATGTFKLKLIRNDYTLGSLIELSPANIDHIGDFTRPQFGELINSVTVKFWNAAILKDDAITVQDIALAQMQGSDINTTIDYSGFTNSIIATRAAQRNLRTMSTPIASCTVYANRDAFPLDIGSAFKLTWPDYGLSQKVMRVTSIAYGDGNTNRIRLTCSEDVYSLPAVAITAQAQSKWVDPNGAPVPTIIRLPYETPYLEAVQQNGQALTDSLLATNPNVAFVGIALGSPPVASINANMNVDSGGGYAIEASVDYCPTAQVNAAVSKTDTTISTANGVNLSTARAGSWLQIGSEIMVFVSIAGSVITVKRGALDTVPATHAVNDYILFWDDYGTNDAVQYVSGQSVNIKSTPITGQGELALAAAPVDVLSLVGRAALPYPPAQFQINGSYYPAVITLTAVIPTWVHRSRLLQTSGAILGTLDATVGPESGTTYNVRYYNDTTNTLLNTETGLTGTTAVGYTPTVTMALRVELESVRGGLVSYQKHVHVLSYQNSYNRMTEAGDRRITEAGEYRLTE